MPLSLPMDMKVTVIIWLKFPLCNIILSVTYPDWLIRLNFRLQVSDNLPTDSHPNSWTSTSKNTLYKRATKLRLQ